ncbi:hypothetical protein [Fusibacter sp. JL216-2]|uniref:hypothetical protein n=1 Tax=Fusibacter sp. JL216-2 TaxID=3071453 RepID=UPI003D33C8DD
MADGLYLGGITDWILDKTIGLPDEYVESKYGGEYADNFKTGQIAGSTMTITYGATEAVIALMNQGTPVAESVEIVSSETANSVNQKLANMGYTEAPYKPGTVVNTIELTEQSTFVRVYDGVNSQQAGGWVMRAKDIAGLTPTEIQNKFALPSTPKYVTDAVFEAGTRLRTGVANGLFGHDGGGTQFDLMGQYIGEFVNSRPLPY